jgi:hypothetical protein
MQNAPHLFLGDDRPLLLRAIGEHHQRWHRYQRGAADENMGPAMLLRLAFQLVLEPTPG